MSGSTTRLIASAQGSGPYLLEGFTASCSCGRIKVDSPSWHCQGHQARRLNNDEFEIPARWVIVRVNWEATLAAYGDQVPAINPEPCIMCA